MACLHETCKDSKHYAKGYCYKHYKQFKRTGKTLSISRCDFNEIIDCGDHYELILTDLKMNENGRAKIDKKFLSKVKNVGRWCLHGKSGYVYNSTAGILLHRLIMSAKDNEEVDHIETGIKNKLDNRKANLRKSTRQENQYNKGIQVNNKSGYKGVSKHKSSGKWIAQIRERGKVKYLGLFLTPEEASLAYNKAARSIQKDFVHKSIICD